MEMPKPKETPDFSKLIEACAEYMENLEDKENGGAYIDNYENDIFEKALQAVYGEKVFDYVNEKTDQLDNY